MSSFSRSIIKTMFSRSEVTLVKWNKSILVTWIIKFNGQSKSFKCGLLELDAKGRYLTACISTQDQIRQGQIDLIRASKMILRHSQRIATRSRKSILRTNQRSKSSKWITQGQASSPRSDYQRWSRRRRSINKTVESMLTTMAKMKGILKRSGNGSIRVIINWHQTAASRLAAFSRVKLVAIIAVVSRTMLNYKSSARIGALRSI